MEIMRQTRPLSHALFPPSPQHPGIAPRLGSVWGLQPLPSDLGCEGLLAAWEVSAPLPKDARKGWRKHQSPRLTACAEDAWSKAGADGWAGVPGGGRAPDLGARQETAVEKTSARLANKPGALLRLSLPSPAAACTDPPSAAWQPGVVHARAAGSDGAGRGWGTGSRRPLLCRREGALGSLGPATNRSISAFGGRAHALPCLQQQLMPQLWPGTMAFCRDALHWRPVAACPLKGQRHGQAPPSSSAGRYPADRRVAQRAPRVGTTSAAALPGAGGVICCQGAYRRPLSVE